MDRTKIKLTNREREILTEMSYGFSSKEIAQKLGISIRTVQTYINTIHLKLGARNKSHAVAIFLKNNNGE